LFQKIIKGIKKHSLFFILIIKDFLGMLSIWQLDHTFSYLVWENNKLSEIARIFTIPIYMYLTDFWILCIFTLVFALYIPELYLIGRYLRRRIVKE